MDLITRDLLNFLLRFLPEHFLSEGLRILKFKINLAIFNIKSTLSKFGIFIFYIFWHILNSIIIIMNYYYNQMIFF